VLEIYNNKLDGRAERKRFILERGLLEPKDKKRPKEERDIEDSLKVFARFHTQEQHESFVEGIISK
jgi:transcriptional adapter 2-alpha